MASPKTRLHEHRSWEEAAFERGTDLELVVGRVEFEPMYEGVEDVSAERGSVGIVGAWLLVPRVSVHRGTDEKNKICVRRSGISPQEWSLRKSLIVLSRLNERKGKKKKIYEKQR